MRTAQVRVRANERLLRRREVESRVGLKKSAIYQRIAKGGRSQFLTKMVQMYVGWNRKFARTSLRENALATVGRDMGRKI